jgi:hypothetical protein
MYVHDLLLKTGSAGFPTVASQIFDCADACHGPESTCLWFITRPAIDTVLIQSTTFN